jgi:hypothetical protein
MAHLHQIVAAVSMMNEMKRHNSRPALLNYWDIALGD